MENKTFQCSHLYSAALLLKNNCAINSTNGLVKHLLDYYLHAWRSSESVLHIAVRYDHREIIQALLDVGYEVNKHIPIFQTPLFQATHYNNVENCKLLLKHGAHVGQSLCLALLNGTKELVELFLSSNFTDFNQTFEINEKKGTPLYFACIGLIEIDIVETLIENGSNINSVCDNDNHIFCALIENCSFHISRLHRCEAIAQLFIKRSLDLTQKDCIHILHLALEKKLYNVVLGLIPLFSSNEPWKDNESGKILLHLASYLKFFFLLFNWILNKKKRKCSY